MEEITYDRTYREHTLIRTLGITALAILILAGVAVAAPSAYVTTLGDYNLEVIITIRIIMVLSRLLVSL